MEFKLHSSFPASDIAPAWNALVSEGITNVPFLRYEYLSTWWNTRGGGEWPDGELTLVTACEDGRLAGIAPFFATTNRDGQPALLLLGSIEISDYLDLIVRREELDRFLLGALDLLGTDSTASWSVLDLYNLPEASPSLPALQSEAAKRGWAYSAEIYKPTPVIPLPGDWETYLAGVDKKQRHEIRRKIRRAEESGRDLRWYIVDDESRLDTEVDGFLRLMAQDPEKANFLGETMRTQMRESVHAAFRAGWLQLAFLDIDGEKACGYLNFDYNDHIWVYNSGLDQKFMDLSPGWVLLGYLLQWANEHKRVEFDFMRGDEDYKYRFGAQQRHVMRVKVLR
jgi:CelD/BcsL family acetyltransferase involved in cellulose biosynthesis